MVLLLYRTTQIIYVALIHSRMLKMWLSLRQLVVKCLFCLSLDCSETLTSPTGTFTSPNYPDYYPNYRDCIFKIIVEVNMQIMLNFTSFSLEGSAPSCSFDFVEIR